MKQIPMYVSDCSRGHYFPGTRVTLDGQDVSSRCWRAEVFEDGSGNVYLYKRNEHGAFFVDPQTGDAITEEMTGRVQIIPPEYVPSQAWEQVQNQWSLA